MAGAWTEVQIAEFREAFCLIDKDSDGVIIMEELASVIRSLNEHPTTEETLEMMNEMDTDGQCTVDMEEFLCVMAGKMKVINLLINQLLLILKLIKELTYYIFVENATDELKEAFKVFDRDQDGFTSAVELRNVIMNLGERLTEEEAEHMIKEADLDGDGFVNFDEFVRMMPMPMPSSI
ncbi:calmodulin-like [Primulina huaijiensis]|uniref:calmodulin-like n=1 Tax=Primulina huaijiensis TaxID=1492673 RepID=UPI003CC71943